jgi:hypothetical protein
MKNPGTIHEDENDHNFSMHPDSDFDDLGLVLKLGEISKRLYREPS